MGTGSGSTAPFGSEVFPPVEDRDRYTRVFNTEMEDAPSYCVLEVFDYDKDNNWWKVRKPTLGSRGRMWFNDSVPIRSMTEGQAVIGFPSTGMYSGDGVTPTAGMLCGPKAQDWFLHPGATGFEIKEIMTTTRGGAIVTIDKLSPNLVDFVQQTGVQTDPTIPDTYLPAKLILFDPEAGTFINPTPEIDVWLFKIAGIKPSLTKPQPIPIQANHAGWGFGRPVYVGTTANPSPSGVPPTAGCPGSCEWLAGLSIKCCLDLTVVSVSGRCACIDQTQSLLFVWSVPDAAWETTTDFKYCNAAGELLISGEKLVFTLPQGRARLVGKTSGYEFTMGCCTPDAIYFGGGLAPCDNTAASDCVDPAGNIFTVKITPATKGCPGTGSGIGSGPGPGSGPPLGPPPPPTTPVCLPGVTVPGRLYATVVGLTCTPIINEFGTPGMCLNECETICYFNPMVLDLNSGTIPFNGPGYWTINAVQYGLELNCIFGPSVYGKYFLIVGCGQGGPPSYGGAVPNPFGIVETSGFQLGFPVSVSYNPLVLVYNVSYVDNFNGCNISYTLIISG